MGTPRKKSGPGPNKSKFPALVTERTIGSLKPYSNNARTHSKRQISLIARSIERFGFTNPVLIDGKSQIICGHGRVAAAKQIGMNSVPTMLLDHLSDAEMRAYVIADNRLAE